MKDTTKVYIFNQGRSCVRSKRKNIKTKNRLPSNFSVDLDYIECAATVGWFVEGHACFG